MAGGEELGGYDKGEEMKRILGLQRVDCGVSLAVAEL